MLLELFRQPERARALSLEAWDDVIRVGRAARLLGTLRAYLHASNVLVDVPAGPARHLETARRFAEYRAHLVESELRAIAHALGRLDSPLILLKGAAYQLNRHPIADGRLPGDVDVLAPSSQLPEIEARLIEAGWQSEVTDDYDQRYYREWSHELPPMHFPGRDIELDLHHAITPTIGRFRPDSALLLAASLPVAGTCWHVLAPEDQLLHAAVHLFQDSDLPGHIRDLVDIYGLGRHGERTTGFWDRVHDRGSLLGLTQPLGLALRTVRRTLDPNFGPDHLCALGHTPGLVAMDWVLTHTLVPPHPDRPTPLRTRLAAWGALLRYHRYRMPPALLVRHLVAKSLRRRRSVTSQRASRSASIVPPAGKHPG